MWAAQGFVLFSVNPEGKRRGTPARAQSLKRKVNSFFSLISSISVWIMLMPSSECQILQQFHASPLPWSLFYVISDIFLTFFVVLTRGIKCILWPNLCMCWAASLREAWGNLIRRAFIEFNTENKAKKVSTENKLPWKWSKSFLSVCLYLISLIFTWKGMLLMERRIVFQGLTYVFSNPEPWDDVITCNHYALYYSPSESFLLPQLCLSVGCRIAYVFINPPIFLDYSIQIVCTN